MEAEGPLDYILSSFGQLFIGILYSMVFSIVNLIIYLIMNSFFNLNPFLYGGISVSTLLFIGRIGNWRSFFWFTGLIFFGLVQFQYQPHIIGLYLGVTFVIGILTIRNNAKYDVASPDITRGVLAKFLVALPRILFYNFSYLLFPLLFIWLGFIGILYLFDFLSLTGSLTQFGILIAIIGGMLGFLQFYIQRHEEEVQNKISSHFTNQIPWGDKFSFEEFGNFLEEFDYKDMNIPYQNQREIANVVDRIHKQQPSKLMQMSEPFRMRGKTIEHNELNVHLSGNQEPDQIMFKNLEEEVSGDTRDDLIVMYREFFSQKQEEILRDIDREELKRISWDLLESISILEESFPTISDVRESMDEEPESYDEFLINARYEIAQKAISIAIGMS